MLMGPLADGSTRGGVNSGCPTDSLRFLYRGPWPSASLACKGFSVCNDFTGASYPPYNNFRGRCLTHIGTEGMENCTSKEELAEKFSILRRAYNENLIQAWLKKGKECRRL